VKPGRPRLAFVSPSFLFPNDTGGRIRTTNTLRGLKGGAFDITLLSPASSVQRSDWATQLHDVCDHFVDWVPTPMRPRWQRAVDLWGDLPVNVASDRTATGLEAVRNTLGDGHFDIAVFDFVHAAVLRPAGPHAASVCFTHNVEAEIFGRHAAQVSNPLMRKIWTSQHAKMLKYEQEALRRFDAVVAVSERDATFFRDRYGLTQVSTISTGVDLDFFAWSEPPPLAAERPPTIVFTGSMDWDANLDGIRHFLAEAWPLVKAERPDVRFVIVGRRPPAWLVEQVKALPGVSCTGFVDDVRPHVYAAHVFVIPLRVGGGTRIKAFEAMAMGCPVVSTAIGIEGLDVVPGEHFLLCDEPAAQARGILDLIGTPALRKQLSEQARQRVEHRFGHRVAAKEFENICVRALHDHRAAEAGPATP
jgi:glycosyltransferase involved in cell wall biosynthesis